MNNVIVIKLTDNWITNEQIKVGINQMLQKYGLEVEKNAITQVFAVNSIPVERRNEKDLIDFVKERIALDIGVQAMKDGLITYEDTYRRELGTIEIQGRLKLLNIRSEQQ